MKTFLLFLIALFGCGCNKPKATDKPATIIQKGTASYGAGAITNLWNSSYYPNYKIDTINGSTSCHLSNFKSNDGYSGLIYMFYFYQSTTGANPLVYGISFAIPADTYPSFNFPLNTPLSYYYNSTSYKSMASICGITFSASHAVSFFDSANVSVTITKFSGSTIDGTFSCDFYTKIPPVTASARNGIFTNVPIKIDK